VSESRAQGEVQGARERETPKVDEVLFADARHELDVSPAGEEERTRPSCALLTRYLGAKNG
jgi:hypothetical protein